MLFSDGSCHFTDDWVNRQTTTARREWVGCTLFYTARPSSEEPRQVYLDALDGMWELRPPYRDVDDVRVVYNE